MNSAISLFVLSCACACTFAQTQVCTQEAIHQCTMNVRQYDIDESAVFRQLYEPEFDALCSAQRAAENCLRPFRRECDLFQSHHLRGLEDAYDYICGSTGRKIYFRHWYCLDEEPMLRAARRCNDTYQRERMRTQQHIHEYGFGELNRMRCSQLNDYLSCVKTALTDGCEDGAEIGEWHYHVHRLSLKYIAEEINCDLSEPLLTPAEIAGIVIGGVAFIVILVLLIYFCTCNLQRYRRRRAQVKHVEEESEEEEYYKPRKMPSIEVTNADKKLPLNDDGYHQYHDQDSTYLSLPGSEAPLPVRAQPNQGQLSSRTRQSLRLNLPETPRSARKTYFATDLHSRADTQSEMSQSFANSTEQHKATRSKRALARQRSLEQQIDE